MSTRYAFLFVGLMVVEPVGAGIVAYEATSFPEEDDPEWVYMPFCDPERWIEDGWLWQHVEVGCGGPPGGDKERYVRSLADFVGEEEFFIEFRMQTTGDSSEIFGVSPAVLVAGGFYGASYHFVIARDQARFSREYFHGDTWVDIEPDVPHTYRVEMEGADFYAAYIDGEVISSGTPGGQYPNDEDDLIVFRTQPWYLPNTTHWDYIRLGTTPTDATGDWDTSGDVDSLDFYFFQDYFSGAALDAGPGGRWADFDFDSDVDLEDFATFQNAFTGAVE